LAARLIGKREPDMHVMAKASWLATHLAPLDQVAALD